MPRKPRQEITSSNSIYHIVCRGNNQRRIFWGARDFKKFLKIIEEAKRKYPFFFYSYNLLSNHYHLEIETIEVSISKIMHQINNTYGKYFRKRHGGSGHLFQGRFYSSLIDKDSYFWEVACYIDLNAVRAGLAKDPKSYQWSSYSAYCQKNYDGNLIDRDRFLKYGGENTGTETARLNYSKFIEERLRLNKEPPFPVNEKMV